MTRLALVLAAALLFVPAARADGPGGYALQFGSGVLSRDGAYRYLAVGSSDQQGTTIEQIATRSGTLRSFVELSGSFGIPTLGVTGTEGAGLSADGKTLVVADTAPSPRRISTFAIVDTRSMRIRTTFPLVGDFAFDAMSPDGSRIYLIQHVSAKDLTRYVVRAYDVARSALLPGRIADRTQHGWVMEGYPIRRVTSSDGRWVYTLYGNQRNVPFVHALDTVRGVAHCVGLPLLKTDPSRWTMRLHGGSLVVGPWRVDTTTWRLSRAGGSGFPWWAWAAIALGAATILAAHVRRTRALAAGAAGRDRSPARLGSWLPLTPTRFGHATTSSSRSSRNRTSGTTSSERQSSRPSTSARSGSSSATTTS